MDRANLDTYTRTFPREYSPCRYRRRFVNLMLGVSAVKQGPGDETSKLPRTAPERVFGIF